MGVVVFFVFSLGCGEVFSELLVDCFDALDKLLGRRVLRGVSGG
jgi:hypothetical protein